MSDDKKMFEKGDVVRLKSGGPAMTVSDFDDMFDTVICEWFDGAKRESSHFTPESLVLVTEQERR